MLLSWLAPTSHAHIHTPSLAHTHPHTLPTRAIPEQPDDGWAFGRVTGGNEGAFPLNFTKLQE